MKRVDALDLLRDLLLCPTAPYREEVPIRFVRLFVAERKDALSLREDRYGNLLVSFRGARPGRAPLVLSAHLDHPGFHALRSRPPRGRALFFGGVPEGTLRGARVRFFSRNDQVEGRVERVRRERGSRTIVELSDLNGPLHGDEFGVFDFHGFERFRDEIWTGAADDLAGAAAILAALDELLRKRRRPALLAVFTRAEETGMVGLQGLLRGRALVRNAVVVSVECSKALPVAPVGEGPVVRVGDKATVFDPEVSAFLRSVAEGLGSSFRFQRRLMDGGTCEASAYALHGFRAGGLCLPLGNYHNVGPDGAAREFVSRRDYLGLVRLLVALALAPRDLGAPARGLRRRLDRAFREGKSLLRARELP